MDAPFPCSNPHATQVSDQKLEKLFSTFDTDKSGKIEYAEFKQCWLRTCDLDVELMVRGIDVPKFATKAWKVKALDDITHEEEVHEAMAIAEAVRCEEGAMAQVVLVLLLGVMQACVMLVITWGFGHK
jgi:hypothetical protein